MPYLSSLAAIDRTHAEGAQKDILDRAFRQVGFIPNMYANMANAPAVLSTYLHGYGLFRSESGLSPAEQEVVFLAVSMANGCSYCTAAHSMIADKVSGVPSAVLKAIRSGAPIPDTRLQALHDLTRELVMTNGQPGGEKLAAFLDVGYSEATVLYLVLAVAVKVLSNYSNHAFGTGLDDRFSAYSLTQS